MPYDSNGIEVRVGDWISVDGVWARVESLSGNEVQWSLGPGSRRHPKSAKLVTIIDPPADRPRKPAFGDAELRALGFQYTDAWRLNVPNARWLTLHLEPQRLEFFLLCGDRMPLPFPASLDDLKQLIRLLGVG